jgi:hypothetical protein
MTQTIVVSAWMLMRGDLVNGRTVEFDPIYADVTLENVHVDYTDGTRETLPKNSDVTVTARIPA